MTEEEFRRFIAEHGPLLGAQRPSVSRALAKLERDEVLARRPDGSW